MPLLVECKLCGFSFEIKRRKEILFTRRNHQPFVFCPETLTPVFLSRTEVEKFLKKSIADYVAENPDQIYDPERHKPKRRKKKEGKKKELHRLRKNPNVDLEKALYKYEEFQWKEPDRIIKIPKPKYPDVLVRLGDVEGIIYKKDSDQERYIHEFEKPPTLLTDPEGKSLYILGGKIRVKRTGIHG